MKGIERHERLRRNAGQYNQPQEAGQASRSALDALKEAQGFLGPLSRSLLEPLPCFGGLSVLGLTVQPAKLQLRLAVSGASRLTQQLQADPAVTLAIALATQQATKATLCFDHTFARRLFEQPTGNPLDPLLAAQPLAVEQPKRHTQRQTRRGSGRDLTSGNRSTRSHAHQGLDG